MMGKYCALRAGLLCLGVASLGLALSGCGGGSHATTSSSLPPAQQQAGQLPASSDSSGQFQTFSTTGTVNFNNEFFQSLGSNGRKCVSCHQPGEGWSVTPPGIQARFNNTSGTDPIFTPNDGSTCPTDDVSTVAARQTAYALLLSKGLIRIARPIPGGAEFTLTGVSDPYNCTTSTALAMFRRPLPSTNLKFENTIMWDSREDVAQLIFDDLKSQAKNATLGHAQSATVPTDAQLTSIVNFETALFNAQTVDNAAGSLTAQGGRGGPQILSQQPFTPGANSVFAAGFNPNAFDLYTAWESLSGTDNVTQARLSIARGEKLFNTKLINIDSVRGLNDVLNQVIVAGTCSTCHSTPNVGNSSTNQSMDIGTANANRRTPDLPLYTLTCTNNSIFQVDDPGLALTTGKCNDIAKLKIPVLRDLAPRAPYFHDGQAATLVDVVDFYNNRFQIGLTSQEKTDLVNFLNSL